MINKQIDEITEEDIENLILNKEREGKTIEYKRDFPDNSDDSKKKFLASIESFANTLGGDLIFGIEEDRDTGEPTNHEGIECQNPDQDVLRLIQLIRDGIEPIIPTNIIKTKVITQANSKIILIIRIIRSRLRPHRIKFQKSHKFYSRASNGKVLMGIQELRSEFLGAELVNEKIRRFLEERVALINSNDGFLTLLGGAKVCVHILPVISFESQLRLGIEEIRSKSWPPIFTGSEYSGRVNIDGILSYRMLGAVCSTYVEVFKNGIIEAVESSMLKPHNNLKLIPSPEFEIQLIEGIKNFLQNLSELDLEKPYYLFITLLGVKGYKKHVIGSIYTEGVDREIIFLPEIIITDNDIEIEKLLKIPFDALYNALGLEKHNSYESDGTWNPHG